METKLNILGIFFESPEKEFYIREVSRLTKINHTTVRQKLNKFVKEGLLKITKNKLYSGYKVNLSKKFLNLKLYYNLEKIRKSKMIEVLENEFDFPVIVVFGSYASARNNSTSDIDICIISEVKKDFDISKYEKLLGRKISLHLFDGKSLEKSKKNNPELINNICNGIVLSGELEILK